VVRRADNTSTVCCTSMGGIKHTPRCRGAMRRDTLALVLAILFILASLSPLISSDNSPVSLSSPDSELSNDIPSDPLFDWLAGQAHIAPSVEHWTSMEEVEVMVLTRDLASLHNWQANNGLLPKQAAASGGQQLSATEPSSGVLEHRAIRMPGPLVAKLPGVYGVVAVFDASVMPEPAGAMIFSDGSGEPATVKSGQIHGATDAWSRGYNGSGVRVAVADSGIDFAHPDLNGTQARLDDASSPYDGWPIMHDPVSIIRWLRDAEAYPSTSASWWSDTSATDIDNDTDDLLDSTGWNISGISPSISGVYHHGEHPDSRLISKAGGMVPVLVVDTSVAGVYDTVYVDIDRDGEFGDESPMNQGNETYGLDTDGDGLWDQSAGLIWWISDGANGVPYADIYAARAGYSNRIAGSGNLTLFMLNDGSEAGGSHGTLCASAVAAQGVVANGKVLGMAPGSELIAVSNLYSGGSWLDSFRFIAEGYDGNASTGHDQAQIGSFSFGSSAAHDDGADYWSMYLDWLTRVHSPKTTYFVAVGNGGHGYGTTASPGGANGVMSVGAFSSRIGESNGGTWGESASWSNRGPNSISRLDPDIVAVGWSASGDTTLNEKNNANSATTTWAGTSLATPVAAGLAAIVYQAYYNQTGQWPGSQSIRDLIMSTADDRGYDPLVQGGGWFNVSRAVNTILGDNGSLIVTPAAWMTGANEGAHRDANLNFLLPGQNQTMTLSLHNSGQTDLSVSLAPSQLVPLRYFHSTWESTSVSDTSNNSTWDGHQSGRPDFVFPLHIKGDANLSLPNATTLIRARAVMEGEGFDGDQNYQSENRLYLRIWRWTDSDGDGEWWNDSDGDGYVDDGDWTEANSEFAMITEHVYASPQVEVRVGNPHDWDGDGLLLGVYRDYIRDPEKVPLHIEMDWTAFGPANDSWISAQSQVIIPANSSVSLPVTIDVPASADGGLRQHGLRLQAHEVDANGTAIVNGTVRKWSWPVITNVAWSGPFTATPKPIDGNMSNQTLYEETWLQGAQRWGWRSESGDWKFLTVDWPTSLSGNGSIIIDVDWANNTYTDVDVHWMSEIAHPFYADDPAAYGPRSVAIETGSTNKDRGSGIYGWETSTGSSHEMIIADDSPGTKQMLLHSAMHGVNTNDNPLNITVGYVAPLGAGLSTVVSDWSMADGNASYHIGSTLPLDVVGMTAHGFTQPEYLASEVAYQDTANDVTTASYIRPFTVTGAQLIEVEIGTHSSGVDLDLYLYRDKNNNGQLDWGNEREAASGNWNSEESISILNPASGTYWVVVHGYETAGLNATFWLRWSEIGGTELVVEGWNSLNSTEISNLYGNGTPSLGGMVPSTVTEVNLSYSMPDEAGGWAGWLDIVLSNGGVLRMPYSYTLLELPPMVEFDLEDGTRTNQTLNISLSSIDLGTGFNLSRLTVDSDPNHDWPNLNSATLDAYTSNGTRVGGAMENWTHWNENRLYSAGSHVVETGGTIALEAESAMSELAGSDNASNIAWQDSTEGVQYTGSGYLHALPDLGIDTGDSTNGSELSWQVEFNSPGTYWIWARVLRVDDGSDSLHVGIDGQPATYGGDGLASDQPGWSWANAVGNTTLNWRAWLSVPSAGRHTISVWMKEDGIRFDRLVLTQNMQWTPPSTPTTTAQRWDDVTIRAAWLNWTMQPDERWQTFNATALDVSNLLNQSSLMIEYDATSPMIAVQGWQFLDNRALINDITIQTDPEATLWFNGSLLEVDQMTGLSSPSIELHPSYWSPDIGGGGESDPWDATTWSWVDLNEFEIVARDPAGNWNNLIFDIAHDPWGPENGPGYPQMTIDRISAEHWGGSWVNFDSSPEPFNISIGEIRTTVIFDVETACLSLKEYQDPWEPEDAPSVFRDCQSVSSPPWGSDSSQHMRSRTWTPPPMLEFTFSFDITLVDDGLFGVVLEVEDWAGNEGEMWQLLTIDRTPPVISWDKPAQSSILSEHFLTLNWSVNEPGLQIVEINGESEVVPGFIGERGEQTFVLERVGNHTICIIASDLTGVSGVAIPNTARECRTFLLPAETYLPDLSAPWNSTHVNTPRVFVDLTLGPNQIYAWWHTAGGINNSNGSIYSVSGGRVVQPIDLVEGENHLLFHLQALDLMFVYRLMVTLDTDTPGVTIDSPEYGTATYRDRIAVEGSCEYGLNVSIVVDSIVTSAACRPDGTYDIWAMLPNDSGEYILTTSQTDLANNTGSASIMVEVDHSAPAALMRWRDTDCTRTPARAFWATPLEADCTMGVEVVLLDDDIVFWSLTMLRNGESVLSQSGTSPDNIGESQIYSSKTGPGDWRVTLEVEDAAGNRQQLTLAETVVAPEATVGEEIRTLGSVLNLALLSAMILIGFAWRAFSRGHEQRDDDEWTPIDVELVIEGRDESAVEDFDEKMGEGVVSENIIEESD